MKGIYLIENTKSGEKYIGSSYKIHSRWGTHLRLLLKGTHHSSELQKSFNNSSLSDLRFSILEVINQDISDRELEERETYYSLLIKGSINRLPLSRDGKVNFSHKRETVINILKTQNRYNPMYLLNADGNIVGEYELQWEIAKAAGVGIASMRDCLVNKRYHRKGFGFILKENYGEYTLQKAIARTYKKTDKKLVRKRHSITSYTIYGEFYKHFSDLYECGKHFNTSPGNIHRRVNVIFGKKNLIDSEITKYVIVTNGVSIDLLKNHWERIFSNIRNSKGDYKIFDCFNNYIGNSNLSELSSILEVTENSIYSAVNKNRHLRTLKIVK